MSYNLDQNIVTDTDTKSFLAKPFLQLWALLVYWFVERKILLWMRIKKIISAALKLFLEFIFRLSSNLRTFWQSKVSSNMAVVWKNNGCVYCRIYVQTNIKCLHKTKMMYAFYSFLSGNDCNNKTNLNWL